MAVQVSARRGCCGLRRDYWEGVIELAADGVDSCRRDDRVIDEQEGEEEGWQGRQAAGIIATHSGGSAIFK